MSENKMSENGNGQGPSLDDIVLERAEDGVTFSAEMGQKIDRMHVPMAGKEVDVGALINHVIHEASKIFEKYFAENPKYHAEWLPSYDALRSLFETTPNAIADGHLTLDGKTALNTLYRTHVQEQVENKGQQSFAAPDLNESRPAAESLINRLSEKWLGPLLKQAKTGAELGGRVRNALTSAYQKAEQWYRTHGNMNEFQPAYAGATATTR